MNRLHYNHCSNAANTVTSYNVTLCSISSSSYINSELAATLRWFTAGGAIRIALRQLLQNRK